MKILLIICLLFGSITANTQTTYKYKRETWIGTKYITGTTKPVTAEWEQMIKTIDSLKSVIASIRQPFSGDYLTPDELAMFKNIPVTMFFMAGDTTNNENQVFRREFYPVKPGDPYFMMSMQYRTSNNTVKFYFKDLTK